MPKRRGHALARSGNTVEGEYREVPSPQKINRPGPVQRINRPGPTPTPPSMPNVNVGNMPSVSTGKPKLVFILAMALYLMATWEGYGKPAWETLTGNADFSPTIPLPMMVGGLVFILILTAVSEAEGGDVALWMVVGMWLLFIMFYGKQTWANFWGWFTGSGTQTPTNGLNIIMDAFKKSTPLPDVSGTTNTATSNSSTGTQNATPTTGTVTL